MLTIKQTCTEKWQLTAPISGKGFEERRGNWEAMVIKKWRMNKLQAGKMLQVTKR
jgi:hypothetical protein